jgi:NAD(P)H-hydrate epimerase
MDSKVLDLNAIWWGVPLENLMENAGAKVAKHCMGYKKAAVIAGRGNNGGDGLVAARLLAQSGVEVHAYAIAGRRSRLNELNLERLSRDLVTEVESAEEIELEGVDIIVDAIFGVGFCGDLREPEKSIIDKINSYDAPKICIDVPSAGAVEADSVISLHSAKVTGAIVEDIGIPIEAERYCGPGDVVYALPKRDSKNHKGDFGRLLVLGGHREYIGTPTLVAQAALKSSVDLVTVCVPQYVADKMPFDPNLIVHPLAGEDKILKEDIDDVFSMEFDAIVFGNGLGRESKDAVEHFMNKLDKPALVDADALSTARKDWLGEKMVLTPHEGEFRKLFGELGEKEKACESAAKETDTVIVLKGGVDVISNGELTRLNDTGNPMMTVGGTGDVLSGIIGGLLAQNGKRMESACAGAFITGIAGDYAAMEYGPSLTATDVISKIPKALADCLGLADG